ncbi:flagellar hook protein FlgE [Sphingomonas sp. CL5.1]|uniref:flagellar hook protein FlgE n=1 Tax=Sphingomonas sp. CL5.1 TaxID=2653203 RepID=UPI001583E089|nr:flagellar hook protein FlgE [Sphingomonas sp. CL5.1]QKR98967.1 flagellar hook protein FlgE [Sphingomonas sp. CL5.1]
MAFYTSLTGLQAAQTDMSVISHNLANVATNGFKKSRSEFADVIASNISTSPTSMVGSGVVVKGNIQQFTQGSFTQSGNALDLAISGDGFFAVKPDPEAAKVNFTRNGGFSVDANHYVVDSNGGHLQVYPVDGSGAVVASGLDSTVSLQLPATSGVAVATSNVKYTLNLSSSTGLPTNSTFDRFDPTSYNNSTSSTVYDANGNALTMTTYFKRESLPDASGNSTWAAYSYIGDQQLTTGGTPGTTLTFNSAGQLTSGNTNTFDPVTPSGATAAQTVTVDFGSSTTMIASPFNVSARSQDGSSVGQIAGVTIDETGLVKASYSNGDVRNLGKVAIINFANPAGLRQIGSSYWQATGLSGDAVAGSASQNGLGSLMTGTIERSNVDITEELVNLIAAQRNFQANSKALDTDNQISQTILNIRS